MRAKSTSWFACLPHRTISIHDVTTFAPHAIWSRLLRNGASITAFFLKRKRWEAKGKNQEWNMKRVWLISVASLALLAGGSGAFSQGQGGGNTGATAPSASPSGQGSGSAQGSTAQERKGSEQPKSSQVQEKGSTTSHQSGGERQQSQGEQSRDRKESQQSQGTPSKE